ncbi:MAG: glycosyltransferase family 4 protein [Elusimicrobia bacterium]|nr:glycosyltransferase family 4 protein [Elusimicrobiota bacterium]
MKILFLATELFNGTGGIKQFNNDFTKALLEMGHSVNVVSMNDNNIVDLFGFDYENFKFTSNSKSFRKIYFIKSVILKSFSFNPDIIICGHVNFSPVCLFVNKFLKIPYFTVTYGLDLWEISKFRLLALKSSQAIVSISNYTKGLILKQLKDYSEKSIFILPCAIDPDKFKPKVKPKYLMDRHKIKESDKVILTVSRLSKYDKYKGYDNVILAVKELIVDIPDVKYILGGFGDDIARIKNLIKCNELDDRVMLTGFISDAELIDYYNLCDIFVMPSKKEGFGIVFIEALACGKPVIAGNKDGSVDALLNGKIGTLIDPDNVEEISQAILNIFTENTDSSLINPKYLRNNVIENFGFKKFKEKLNRIIEEYDVK